MESTIESKVDLSSKILTVADQHLVPQWQDNTEVTEQVVKFGLLTEEFSFRVFLKSEKLAQSWLDKMGGKKTLLRDYAQHEHIINVEDFPYVFVKFNPEYSSKLRADESLRLQYKDNEALMMHFLESRGNNFRYVLPVRDFYGIFPLDVPLDTDGDPIVDWDHDVPRFAISKDIYQVRDFIRIKDDFTTAFLTQNVDGLILYHDIKARFKHYADTKDHVATILALYTMMTHVYEVFNAIPYLQLFATMGSGKTKILQTIALMAHMGEFVADPTAATLFRTIDLLHATMCIDEAEKINEEQNQQILAASNAGYQAGPMVPRYNNEKKMVERFCPFSPKIFASTEPLPPTLESRCLRVELTRTDRPDLFANREPFADREILKGIQSDLVIWAIDVGSKICAIDRQAVAQKYRAQFEGVPARLIEISLPILVLYDFLHLDEDIGGYKSERENLKAFIEYERDQKRSASVSPFDEKVLTATYWAAASMLSPIHCKHIRELIDLSDGEDIRDYKPGEIGKVLKRYDIPKRDINGKAQYFGKMTPATRHGFMIELFNRYSLEIDENKPPADFSNIRNELLDHEDGGKK